MIRKVCALVMINIVFQVSVYCQNSNDTLQGRHLYRPSNNTINQDQPVDSQSSLEASPIMDSLEAIRFQAFKDSILKREQFIQDSILAREAFVRDSIAKREQFIRDSIARRKRILDSLNILVVQFPRLIEASLKATSDDIFINQTKAKIIGDTMLSSITFSNLPIAQVDPYRPWEKEFDLNKDIKSYKTEGDNKTINFLHFKNIAHTYQSPKNNLLIIKHKRTMASSRSGKTYKIPLDSVFYDNRGRITHIKQYHQFYKVGANYAQGPHLFNYLHFVKQYSYQTNGMLSNYKTISFCERKNAYDPQKVCLMINYAFTINANIFTIKRTNDPKNNFADGTLVYEFDNIFNLKSVSFNNFTNSENWTNYIELNDEGFVSRYIYKNKGVVNKTLLLKYYHDDPNAKHKLETITCIFEDDGISYFQKNNTTGKTRERSKYTGEWSPWR
ncbi:MAG: hypothetical protein MI922_24390 [Bacteroidales bacterium]|nr:hypothetical protein [Bacteroidales bacterium]